MGTTSFGGVQHLAGLRMLRRGGVNQEEVTVILAGDPATQLQSIVNGAIHIAVLSPPTVILARDKFKLNVLANALDEFPSFFQSGLAVADKSLSSQNDLVKRILRARAKANRFFLNTKWRERSHCQGFKSRSSGCARILSHISQRFLDQWHRLAETD